MHPTFNFQSSSQASHSLMFVHVLVAHQSSCNSLQKCQSKMTRMAARKDLLCSYMLTCLNQCRAVSVKRRSKLLKNELANEVFFQIVISSDENRSNRPALGVRFDSLAGQWD